MKTVMSLMTALSVAAALPLNTQAGQGEWATAGKVLTGVVAAGVLVEALRPHHAAVVACAPPAASVVYAYPPAPQAVYAPVPAPVVIVPAPFYSYGAACYGPYYGAVCRPVYAHPPYVRRGGVVVHFGGRW